MKFELHETTSDYLNTFFSYSFMPTSILPTRVTDHSAILIDYMFYYIKNFQGMQEINSQTLQIILLIFLYLDEVELKRLTIDQR